MSDRRGFTLVEVLIGATILVIGFVPVYLLIFQSEKSTVETMRSIGELTEAQSLLDEISHLPYGQIPVTDEWLNVHEFKSMVKEHFTRFISASLQEGPQSMLREVMVTSADQGKWIRVRVRDTRSDRPRDDDALLELGVLTVDE